MSESELDRFSSLIRITSNSARCYLARHCKSLERRDLTWLKFPRMLIRRFVRLWITGKFQYEKSKRAKEAKKKQAKVILKELKFNSVRTGDHDFQFKMRHAREFLSNGWKVKITVRFKGREMAHTDLGRKMLQRFTDDIADIGEVEQSPRMETRTMFIILGPKSS